MRLSTRARYGLRAMIELAQGFEKNPVPMRTIAENQEISLKYLHALLTILKGAGLVRSVRGAGGGYSLTRPPSQIRMSEVVRALEGTLSIVNCVEDRSVCRRRDHCPARNIWRDLSRTIESTLSSLTLNDVVARAREAGSRMYYI